MTFNDIILRTADHFVLAPAELLGVKREARIVRARHVAMYLVRELVGWTHAEIGWHFGERDESSVMHAVASVGKKIGTDPELAYSVAYLRRELAASKPVEAST